MTVNARKKFRELLARPGLKQTFASVIGMSLKRQGQDCLRDTERLAPHCQTSLQIAPPLWRSPADKPVP
jgi:hypothetical protein